MKKLKYNKRCQRCKKYFPNEEFKKQSKYCNECRRAIWEHPLDQEFKK